MCISPSLYIYIYIYIHISQGTRPSKGLQGPCCPTSIASPQWHNQVNTAQLHLQSVYACMRICIHVDILL